MRNGLITEIIVMAAIVIVFVVYTIGQALNDKKGMKIESASFKKISEYKSEKDLKLFQVEHLENVYVLVCPNLDIWEAVFGRMIVARKNGGKIIKFSEIKNYKRGRWIAFGNCEDINYIADFFQKVTECRETLNEHEQKFLKLLLFNKLIKVKDGKYCGNCGNLGKLLGFSQDREEYMNNPKINYRLRYVFKHEILHVLFFQDSIYAKMMTQVWNGLNEEQQKVFKLMLKSFGLSYTAQESTIINEFMTLMQDIDRHFEDNPVFNWYYQKFLPADESKFVLDYCQKHKEFFDSLRTKMNQLTRDYMDKRGIEYPIDWFEK
jgi:hypothetical protein